MNFLSGLIVGLASGLALSIVSAAGKDIWDYIRNKISPPPIQVHRDFGDKHLSAEEVQHLQPRWSTDEQVYNSQQEGFVFYETKKRQRCYQITRGGPTAWLMVRKE